MDASSGGPRPDPAAALPEELEQRAYDVLLESPTADRAAAFDQLLAGHPQHREALVRLRRKLVGAETALQGTGLAETPPPACIGPYTLVRKLGEGGFGVVWLARQERPLARQVALKLIRPGMDTATVLRRFDAERELLARLDHPGIARVLDAGTTATGEPFLVTEYVDGVPLTRCGRTTELSLRQRLQLFAAVCDGVHHAHQRGVIHRDLKPSNVLVTTVDGRPQPKIIDFGIARAMGGERRGDLTRAGTLLGTPEYMSPEQAEGDDVDVRTDVYALGVLLFELLVDDLPHGRERWRRAGFTELLDLIRHGDVPPPSRCVRDPALARALLGDVDWIVRTAMHKDRERRYATVAELRADVDRHLAHQPIAAGPPGLGYQLRKFVRRHRLAVLSATVSLLAVLVGLASALVAWRDTAAAEREARRRVDEFDCLADVVVLRDLQQRAADAWPATPDRIVDYTDWLRRARALLARGPARRTVRDRLAAESRADAQQFLHETLLRLDQDVAALDGAHGLVADIERRLQFARTVHERTVVGPAAAWTAAASAVAADPRFHGLHLHPQPGLVPLGADPDSGLQEFAVAQTGTMPTRGSDGRLQFADDSAVVLVLLPGGRFWMGSQDRDPARPNFAPALTPHGNQIQEVELAPFLLARHEMTRAQWRCVFGDDPSGVAVGTETDDGPIGPRHPVENLAWTDAQRAMARLGLCLPTEAQWEYACRAGSTGRWFTGDDVADLQDHANIAGAEAGRLRAGGLQTTEELEDAFVFVAPVGRLRPNRFGLHDMLGNLAEWCADAFATMATPVRPGDGLRAEGPPEAQHALRGGTYGDPAMRATCAFRGAGFGNQQNALAGVRPAAMLAAVPVSRAR